MAFELPITAFRYAYWGGPDGSADLIQLVDDWSGATFEWIIADKPGGAVKITLNNAAEGSQGVSATYDSDYPHPSTGAEVGGTTIRPQINKGTLQALDDPDPVSSDIEYYHTLYVTPVGGLKTVHCFGDFTIKQGAPA